MHLLPPRPARSGPACIGWLFPYDWDRRALDALQAAGAQQFDRAGFDLFSFPRNAQLIGFDLQRFAERQAARGRRRGWRGVLSHHEQFGALAAALVAEQLGLRGARPESVLAAQHKLHARRVLAAVAPEANLPFAVLDAGYDGALPATLPPGLSFPLFVKPVKGAFSVLARRIDDAAALQAHLRFGWREAWIARRLLTPFDRVCAQRLPQAGGTQRWLAEQPVPAGVPQFNLDGWVQDGRVHALGVVDAITAPGTQAFIRWELPSRLPAAVQARALDVARRFLRAIDYRHGFFNLEFFFDEATDRLTVIECNPRLASQFGDLYRRVLGIDPHAMAAALACGEDPQALPRSVPSAGVAASLVYRAFDPTRVPPSPSLARRRAFRAHFADALLLEFRKHGRALARDFAWTGSHRHGVVHLGGVDRDDLERRAHEASALLGWPAPYAIDDAAARQFGDQPGIVATTPARGDAPAAAAPTAIGAAAVPSLRRNTREALGSAGSTL